MPKAMVETDHRYFVLGLPRATFREKIPSRPVTRQILDQ